MSLTIKELRISSWDFSSSTVAGKIGGCKNKCRDFPETPDCSRYRWMMPMRRRMRQATRVNFSPRLILELALKPKTPLSPHIRPCFETFFRLYLLSQPLDQHRLSHFCSNFSVPASVKAKPSPFLTMYFSRVSAVLGTNDGFWQGHWTKPSAETVSDTQHKHAQNKAVKSLSMKGRKKSRNSSDINTP